MIQGEFESVMKGEDEVTTQHHSVIGSDGRPDSKGEINQKDDELKSDSDESSFISGKMKKEFSIFNVNNRF
jgi:hypothetical protein